MAVSCLNTLILLILLPSLFDTYNAQVSTACTSSLITSFTPCMNFVTGSSATGSSPTHDCCNSIRSLMTDNIDCVCLIVTGNVPVSIPFINSSIAVTLPRACQSSVPLQCKATGVPLPPPGPVLFGPSPAPLSEPESPTPSPAPHHRHKHSPPPVATPILAPHAHSPRAHSHTPKVSKALAAPPPVESSDRTPPPGESPTFALGPAVNPGIRPVFNPNSASTSSLYYFVILLYVGVVTVACLEV